MTTIATTSANLIRALFFVVAASTATSLHFLNAQVIAYDSESEQPCSSKGQAIGGTPACFTIGKNTELYLCDSNNDVLISLCAREDCTECELPKLNWYGYVDGRCQDNGWLKPKCTSDTVDQKRFAAIAEL